MRLLPFLLLGLAACSSKSNASTTSTAASEPARSISTRPAGSAAASAAPGPSDALHERGGVGIFVDERLQLCMDADLVYDTPAEAADALAKLKKIAGDGGTVATFFEKGCAPSFKDRTALASCKTDAATDKPHRTGTKTSTFYTVEALEEDKAMRECTSKGGKWDAIPRDSEVFQKADLEAKLRKNEADLKRLQGK